MTSLSLSSSSSSSSSSSLSENIKQLVNSNPHSNPYYLSYIEHIPSRCANIIHQHHCGKLFIFLLLFHDVCNRILH